jgi:riboflavin transporter FmnP
MLNGTYNNRQHTAPTALDSQQVARVCGGRYVYKESTVNSWIFAAGIMGLFTSLVHIFAGQLDPVRPFLKSDLPDIPKATLLGCWHMVSAILVLSGFALTYIGWFNLNSLQSMVIGISISFIIFSLVFIAVGWYFFKFQAFIKLPQWVLLLPIGILGLVGAL